MRNLIYILILLSCLGCSSSISIAGVSPSRFVVMKEYQKFWGSHLNPNGHMGTYVVLDSRFHTFTAHSYALEEVGAWYVRHDTLFLETRMRMWLRDSSLIYKPLETPSVRQFIMNKQGYYDEVTLISSEEEDQAYLRRIRDTLKLRDWKTLWEQYNEMNDVWMAARPSLVILQKPKDYEIR